MARPPTGRQPSPPAPWLSLCPHPYAAAPRAVARRSKWRRCLATVVVACSCLPSGMHTGLRTVWGALAHQCSAAKHQHQQHLREHLITDQAGGLAALCVIGGRLVPHTLCASAESPPPTFGPTLCGSSHNADSSRSLTRRAGAARAVQRRGRGRSTTAAWCWRMARCSTETTSAPRAPW